MPETMSLLEPSFLSRLEQLELVSKKIFVGRMKGERLSKRKGQSVEFADFRPYVVGDDLRFLDWNLFARLDRLFLRVFLEEEDLHFYLLIDQSASMDFGTPSKLQYAKQIAAALGFIGLVNLDRVVIQGFNDRLTAAMPALRGRPSLPRLLTYLDGIEAAGVGDISKAMRSFGLRCPGRGVVVLLSDFLDKGGYEDAMRSLLARNMDIYVIQILAREDIEPPMVGDLKLIDAEDDDEAEITISRPLLERYNKTLNAFRSGLNEFCTKRGIGYLFTSNEVPFDRLVLGYLRQRGLVR